MLTIFQILYHNSCSAAILNQFHGSVAYQQADNEPKDYFMEDIVCLLVKFSLKAYST